MLSCLRGDDSLVFPSSSKGEGRLLLMGEFLTGTRGIGVSCGGDFLLPGSND